MSINELKIYLDLSLESKTKVLDKYAKKFYFSGYFFVDSDDGHCYLFNRRGKEKDVSMIHEITEDIIPKDIKKIVIPNSVMNIRYAAFYNCTNLTSVTIPDSVTSIGNFAFADCRRLTSMTIPDSVTSIGGWAFENCGGLTDVKIPDNVVNIERYTFYYCNNLKSLVFKNKTINQVKSMKYYPFGIKDKSIIKAELS